MECRVLIVACDKKKMFFRMLWWCVSIIQDNWDKVTYRVIYGEVDPFRHVYTHEHNIYIPLAIILLWNVLQAICCMRGAVLFTLHHLVIIKYIPP